MGAVDYLIKPVRPEVAKTLFLVNMVKMPRHVVPIMAMFMLILNVAICDWLILLEYISCRFDGKDFRIWHGIRVQKTNNPTKQKLGLFKDQVTCSICRG